MNIWHIHPVTGELLGTGTADADPLEPGNWLVPAHAVTVAPPATIAGHARVFAAGSWSQVVDHRGETWWTAARAPVLVTALGDPSALGLMSSQPPAPPPTTTELIAYTAEKRWRAETGGVPLGGGLVIPSDDRAKMLIMGAAGAMTDEATAPFVIGSIVRTFTGAQFKAAHAAIVARVQACFAKQAEVLTAINTNAITTIAEIDAAGWPPNQ